MCLVRSFDDSVSGLRSALLAQLLLDLCLLCQEGENDLVVMSKYSEFWGRKLEQSLNQLEPYLKL